MRTFVPWIALAAGLALAGCAPKPPGSYAIRVTDKGFEPAETVVPRGQAVTLTVTRKTDETCATELVIPALHQRYALPLNQPVAIALPAGVGDTLHFACGMDMYSGTIVAR